MSLHHVLIVHGSEPNHASWPRIGFAIRYVPTHVRQLSGEKDSAMLVRGTDTHHNFEHELPPEAELHPMRWPATRPSSTGNSPSSTAARSRRERLGRTVKAG